MTYNERLEEAWHFKYELCKQYYKKYGDINIPKRYTVTVNGEKINLGAWLSSQREMYFRKGKRKYNQNHVDKLEELGINWKPINTCNNISFNEAALLYYCNLYCPVKIEKLKNEIEIDLYSEELKIGIEYDGIAFHNKNQDLIKNEYCKKNGIKLYRIREIGLNNLNSSSLDIYYDRSNKCYFENIIKIAIRIFKGDTSNIDINIDRDSEIIYNELLNFSLQKWKEKYFLCKLYFKEYGNLDIPESKIIKNIKIGQWLADQKKYKKLGKLSSFKIKLLDDLNIIWEDYNDVQWNKNFELLKEYCKLNKCNINIPDNTKYKNIAIGNWLTKERAKYFNKGSGKRNEEHIIKLEEIGVIWDIKEYKWMINYNLLKEYYNINQNSDVPYNYITQEGVKLGIWVSKQRKYYKNKTNSKFTQNRIDLLNELNFKW